MKPSNDYTPAATVAGLYQVDGCCLEPLSEEYPLTPEEVSEFPIVIDLEFDPACDYDSIIVDLIYDNMDPIPLPDLIRGSNIPCCVPYWFHWFTIPDVVLHDKKGRITDPRAPGIHTVQIHTARKTGITGKERNFSPANGGWMSGVTIFAIADEDSRELSNTREEKNASAFFDPEDPGGTDDGDE